MKNCGKSFYVSLGLLTVFALFAFMVKKGNFAMFGLENLFQILFILFIVSPPIIVVLLLVIIKQLKDKKHLK